VNTINPISVTERTRYLAERIGARLSAWTAQRRRLCRGFSLDIGRGAICEAAPSLCRI